MSTTMLEHALQYLGKGLSVIPCGKDKAPLIKWLSYQQKRATEEEINAWWGKLPTGKHRDRHR